ncbi:hypothetical protein Y1Q_0009175 [Alligator mississippiensis]|uniref:Uncharacterized protein n=1 Tax=Alligator mississippiensis TaxID=8496 RepID=A0A151M2L0_ALLMI|nr:hypothetical protein Y1Q_0009175 [Alligator mississippiensis]
MASRKSVPDQDIGNFQELLSNSRLASLYAMGLVLTTWLWPADKGLSENVAEADGGASNSHVHMAHCIILLVESVLFGLFVTVIFYDQVVSIITDETPIEQLRNRLLKEANREVAHTRKPKIALLREVFGRGFVICWFFPCNCSPPSVRSVLIVAWEPPSRTRGTVANCDVKVEGKEAPPGPCSSSPWPMSITGRPGESGWTPDPPFWSQLDQLPRKPPGKETATS